MITIMKLFYSNADFVETGKKRKTKDNDMKNTIKPSCVIDTKMNGRS